MLEERQSRQRSRRELSVQERVISLQEMAISDALTPQQLPPAITTPMVKVHKDIRPKPEPIKKPSTALKSVVVEEDQQGDKAIRLAKRNAGVSDEI
jgi:hypothetical protein